MEISYEKAFNQIIDFLETIESQYKIRYYLVGGILVSIYSETRTTQDIDFVVDLNSAHYNIDSYIEILKQNIVPFYCCAWSNIKSVRTAVNSCLKPAWIQMTAKNLEFISEANNL